MVFFFFFILVFLLSLLLCITVKYSDGSVTYHRQYIFPVIVLHFSAAIHRCSRHTETCVEQPIGSLCAVDIVGHDVPFAVHVPEPQPDILLCYEREFRVVGYQRVITYEIQISVFVDVLIRFRRLSTMSAQAPRIRCIRAQSFPRKR